MPKKLFADSSPDAEPIGDVLIEGVTDAPVATVTPLAAVPAVGTPDPLFASTSSAEWRETHLPALQSRIADATARHAAAVERAGVIELSLALGHDGADALAVEHREALRLLEIELAGLRDAERRARVELQAALRREQAVDREKRAARAAELVLDRIALADKFDAGLRELAATAEEIASSNRKLATYDDVVKGVSWRRLTFAGRYRGAAHVAGAALGKLLGLDHDGVPPARLEPLGVRERALFGYAMPDLRLPDAPAESTNHIAPFAPRVAPDAPAVTDAATDAAPAASLAPAQPVPARRVDPEASRLGEHGCRVLHDISTGGRVYSAGELIDGATVLTWPVKNRAMLERQHRVAFLPAPASDPMPAETDEAAAQAALLA